MCFVVEGNFTNSAPANPVNDDCTCSHQGNFEPFHIAQTENEKFWHKWMHNCALKDKVY